MVADKFGWCSELFDLSVLALSSRFDGLTKQHLG